MSFSWVTGFLGFPQQILVNKVQIKCASSHANSTFPTHIHMWLFIFIMSHVNWTFSEVMGLILTCELPKIIHNWPHFTWIWFPNVQKSVLASLTKCPWCLLSECCHSSSRLNFLQSNIWRLLGSPKSPTVLSSPRAASMEPSWRFLCGSFRFVLL